MSRASGRARALGKTARHLNAWDLESAGHASEALRRELARLRERIGERRADEVLEHVDIVRIDGVLRDPNVADVLRAREHDRDGPATSRALDGRLGELGLRLRHVGL